MLPKSKTFEIKSKITDNWGGSHRVALDLKALSTAQDWKIEIALADDYKIDQIYGGELSREQGKTYFSGKSWNQDLNKGDTAEVILIVEEGSNQDGEPIPPTFFGGDPVDNSMSEIMNSDKSTSAINFDTKVVEDWYGGYKLEADLMAKSNLQDWQVDFSLPYTIRETYGVNISDRGNGNYTIKGLDNQANLRSGQFLRPIFIVDDNGQEAIAPKPMFSNTETETKTETEPMPVPEVSSNTETETETETEPMPVPENTNVPEPATSSPAPVSNQKTGRGEDISAQPEGNGKIINVDSEFGGNLQNAIDASNNGDVILLSNNVYYTDGLTLDKDITIDGQQGSIINGRGTSESIINLTSNAAGATIQDVEITNGSIGIYGYKVFDLTLQNLDINNIGLDQTVRDGQYNTGIVLNGADGLRLVNSDIYDVGRKGAGVNDTDGAYLSGLNVRNVNLAAQHVQSFDAAGVKFFNTNDVVVKDSYFSDINANHIWNDTTNATTIKGNVVSDVGSDFSPPDFNPYVDITGIYNEKSSNSIVRNNEGTAVDDFTAFKATEFSTETMVLENNNFSSFELNTTDFWANEEAEKLIATTEDPYEADFSLFADEFFAQANIG